MLDGILYPFVLMILYPGNLSFSTSFLEFGQLSRLKFVSFGHLGVEASGLLPQGPPIERVNVCFGKTTKGTKCSVKVQDALYYQTAKVILPY